MDNSNTIFITGEVKWAKVLDPVLNYKQDAFEYSFDIEIDQDTLAQLRTMGLPKNRKIKNDVDADGNVLSDKAFITLRRPVVSAAGKKLPSLKVLDKAGEAVTDLIGNGSIVKAKVKVLEYDNKFGKGITLSPVAIQVLDHIKYEVEEPTAGFDFESSV